MIFWGIIFLILLSVMPCVKIMLQEQDVEYSSKEADEYYKNMHENFVFFEPLDTAFILGFQSEYYEIHKSDLNYEPYTRDKFLTPYQDSIMTIEDSIHSIINSLSSAYQDSEELPDSITEKIDELNESFLLVTQEFVGKVMKYNILKHEKKDSIEAFVYESYEYEDDEPGIWISYSENNGKDWSYYYTGLVQNQPVFIKYYSQRPLIREKGKLEMDACFLRQDAPFSYPIPEHNYECIQDGIYVVFDMNVIARDSDCDGLTDIVEDKLFLNKYNPDTDCDGIPDNLDVNPRVNYPRTEKCKIFEALLNDDIGNKKKDWTFGRLVFKGKNDIFHVTDSTQTVLIVTDDKDLMGIQPQKYRVIVMTTTEEYNNHKHTYNSVLNKMFITPLFKIDNKKNTYMVSYGINTWSTTYLVKKMIIGWRIKTLSKMIT